MRKCVHTMPSPEGGWVNRLGFVVLSQHEAKSRAVLAGRHQAQARYAEHAIHGRDGQIAERVTYGHSATPMRLSA